MYLQSKKYIKHNAAKSVNRSILKEKPIFRFGVFIVISSMPFSYASSPVQLCLTPFILCLYQRAIKISYYGLSFA